MADDYESRNFRGDDFSGQNLSGAKFIRCSFADVTFREADLRGAAFISCKAHGPLSFESANMDGVVMKHCVFPKAWFKKARLQRATICNCDLRGANLLACRLNRSLVDGLDISRCNLNLASFIDTQLLSVNFRPVRRIPFLRGVRFFKRTPVHLNTIFTNNNRHDEFTSYCLSEMRKDRFFTGVNKLPGIVRAPGLLMLALFGLITDFGQSFSRWFFCALLLMTGFTFLFMCAYESPLADAVTASLVSFFGFGISLEVPSLLYIAESIAGYFMLGILVSLLTTKLSIN